MNILPSHDEFRILAAPSLSELRIDRSRFLAIALPIESEESFTSALAGIQKEHFDATHHCWAWRLRDGLRSRSSDAGEPSGTAGRPILAQIEASGLWNLTVIVVRWYGGVKLGTGGLGRAYRDAAAGALAEASATTRILYRSIEIDVPFPRISEIYRLISSPDVVLGGESFGETNVFRLLVRESRVDEFARSLAGKRFSHRLGDREVR